MTKDDIGLSEIVCAILIVIAFFGGAFIQSHLSQGEYQRGFSEGYENGYSNACIAVNSGYGAYSCGSVWAEQKSHAMERGGLYYTGTNILGNLTNCTEIDKDNPDLVLRMRCDPTPTQSDEVVVR